MSTIKGSFPVNFFRLAFLLPIIGFWGVAHGQPLIPSLPDEISGCQQVLLDAGNAGANYLWSTGDTSQVIFPTQSGIYWVLITQGVDTLNDTSEVVIMDLPTISIPSDTNFCGAGNFTISSSGIADSIYWYIDNDSSNGEFVGSGQQINLSFQDSTTLQVQGWNYGPQFFVGPDSIKAI
ncbi:MAG: hypothetical protein D6785_11550, partial [Planctomycetota bacterium]